MFSETYRFARKSNGSGFDNVAGYYAPCGSFNPFTAKDPIRDHVCLLAVTTLALTVRVGCENATYSTEGFCQTFT